MGDGNIQMCQDQWFKCGRNMENIKDHSPWMMMNEGNSSSSSTISNSSCSSSLETMDDASSSSSDGPLSDLSTLMAQLPIKRGLSKYYEGKSESFTCMTRVTRVEDLPKKETCYNRRKMMNKSSYKSYTLPKSIIFKKASRTSFLSSCYTSKKSNSSISRRSSKAPPLIPEQKT